MPGGPDRPDGAGDGPSSGRGGGAVALLERIRIHATSRVLLLVLAAASVIVLLISGATVLAARTFDSGLSRVDVISTSFGSIFGTDENILLVGLDTRTDSFGNPLPKDILASLNAGAGDSGGDSTDTIIVLHIPGGGGPATGFSIPRDSYVDVTGGFGTHKINSAYSYGSNAARQELSKDGVRGSDLAVQAGAAGAKTTIGAVEGLTGLTITHFAAVNLAGFAQISEAIGGVPVCLNKAVDDSFSGAKFPAGQTTVSGPQALAFVRQRHGLPGGDLDRARRQQVFLSSMARTVLSSDTLTDSTKRNALIDAVDKAVTVDRQLDVLDLATQVQGVSSGSIGFHTIPIVNASYDTAEDGEAVKVDPSAVQKYISDTISGAGDTTTAPKASGSSGSAAGSNTGGSSPGSAAPKTSAAPAVPAEDAGTTAPTVPCVN
ncbi:LCP family protein [Actinomycetospora sp. NBRC 106378]|uniref:LCP family protein n=1 Tax=Actinomycetospora sp. NBRC 106378 TaxID=3032208 RepID=UPI0024A56AD9|nr:LCP family protein [Actinomycetospora sp. NBRC 106378]GLZ53736.1 LytTR family transcriptional regulator [Actinomycetospora sp. NBRC 106378]